MTSQDNSLDQYLQPTPILNSDHPDIIAFTKKTLNGATAPEEQARKLFYAVRDNIAYDPRVPFYLPEHYAASTILKNGRGYCVQKACLLCAVGRAAGIPSRLGFADIRNHGASPEIVEMMGCDIFAYHGYTEFFLNGRWIKATPAFNMAVFEKHNIAPVEFDGRNDAVFPPRDLDGNLYVEYLTYHGTSADLPLDDIMAGWRKVYGAERVKLWKGLFEELFQAVSQQT
jgi:transglutaminase-like putative cysteine protease